VSRRRRRRRRRRPAAGRGVRLAGGLPAAAEHGGRHRGRPGHPGSRGAARRVWAGAVHELLRVAPRGRRGAGAELQHAADADAPGAGGCAAWAAPLPARCRVCQPVQPAVSWPGHSGEKGGVHAAVCAPRCCRRCPTAWCCWRTRGCSACARACWATRALPSRCGVAPSRACCRQQLGTCEQLASRGQACRTAGRAPEAADAAPLSRACSSTPPPAVSLHLSTSMLQARRCTEP
jgi:hypothetical protein